MGDAGRLKPNLCVLEPTTQLAQDCVVAHLAFDEANLCLPANRVGADGGDVAHNLEPWVLCVDDEERWALFCLSENDRECGSNRSAGIPFVAVYHPALTASCGLGEQHRRIRASAGGRLRHREARAYLACCQRHEVTPPLVFRAVVHEDNHVGLIRWRAVHRAGRQVASSRLFENDSAVTPR